VSKDKVHLIANGFDLDIFKVIPQATKAVVLPEFDIEATDAPLETTVSTYMAAIHQPRSTHSPR
jgi:hypothetical protein